MILSFVLICAQKRLEQYCLWRKRCLLWGGIRPVATPEYLSCFRGMRRGWVMRSQPQDISWGKCSKGWWGDGLRICKRTLEKISDREGVVQEEMNCGNSVLQKWEMGLTAFIEELASGKRKMSQNNEMGWSETRKPSFLGKFFSNSSLTCIQIRLSGPGAAWKLFVSPRN